METLLVITVRSWRPASRRHRLYEWYPYTRCNTCLDNIETSKPNGTYSRRGDENRDATVLRLISRVKIRRDRAMNFPWRRAVSEETASKVIGSRLTDLARLRCSSLTLCIILWLWRAWITNRPSYLNNWYCIKSWNACYTKNNDIFAILNNIFRKCRTTFFNIENRKL